MEEKQHQLRMINIEAMIDVLTMLWNKGVDYVDISGKQGEDQDEICFSFCKEYMDKDHSEGFDDEFGPEDEKESNDSQVKVKLTDKDIDDLI